MASECTHFMDFAWYRNLFSSGQHRTIHVSGIWSLEAADKPSLCCCMAAFCDQLHSVLLPSLIICLKVLDIPLYCES